MRVLNTAKRECVKNRRTQLCPDLATAKQRQTRAPNTFRWGECTPASSATAAGALCLRCSDSGTTTHLQGFQRCLHSIGECAGRQHCFAVPHAAGLGSTGCLPGSCCCLLCCPCSRACPALPPRHLHMRKGVGGKQGGSMSQTLPDPQTVPRLARPSLARATVYNTELPHPTLQCLLRLVHSTSSARTQCTDRHAPQAVLRLAVSVTASSRRGRPARHPAPTRWWHTSCSHAAAQQHPRHAPCWTAPQQAPAAVHNQNPVKASVHALFPQLNS